MQCAAPSPAAVGLNLNRGPTIDSRPSGVKCASPSAFHFRCHVFDVLYFPSAGQMVFYDQTM